MFFLLFEVRSLESTQSQCVKMFFHKYFSCFESVSYYFLLFAFCMLKAHKHTSELTEPHGHLAPSNPDQNEPIRCHLHRWTLVKVRWGTQTTCQGHLTAETQQAAAASGAQMPGSDLTGNHWSTEINMKHEKWMRGMSAPSETADIREQQQWLQAIKCCTPTCWGRYSSNHITQECLGSF